MTCPNCGADPGSRWFCQRCGMPLPQTAAIPPPPAAAGRRRLTRWTLGAIAGAMTLCVLLLIVASTGFDPAALILSVAAAAVPALCYSYLVLRLDRYEREPRRAILAAFGWGAVAAIFLAIVLELITGSVLIATVGEDAAGALGLVVGAPLIEETTKGIALLGMLRFFRRELDNVLDGLIYGALIGLGFAMTEDILYFGAAYIEGGAGDLGELFVARVVIAGFGHAVYTATTGAAVGWARSRYERGTARYVVPVLGWSLAVLQHALWNGGILLVAGLADEDASVIEVVLIMTPLFTLPPLFALLVIARLAGRKELTILRDQLAPEVAGGVLTPREYEVLTSAPLRRDALRRAEERGGRELRARQRHFFQIAAELAFRKHHLSRGETPTPGQRAPEDAYRAELATIRAELLSPGRVVAQGALPR